MSIDGDEDSEPFDDQVKSPRTAEAGENEYTVSIDLVPDLHTKKMDFFEEKGAAKKQKTGM